MRSAAALIWLMALCLLQACLGVGGGAAHAGALLLPAPRGWTVQTLPGAQPGVDLVVLKRPALVEPVRYRVVVLPGSGCTGWLPLAERYFAGLLHAELWVLHKPGVDIHAGASADCAPDFVQSDALAAWRDHAGAALGALEKRQRQTAQLLPQLLLGISEGAELLPYLAPEISALAGVVMVANSGLDPREAGELQVLRLGQWPAWQGVASAQASDAADEVIVQGRSLKYWRDFWSWPLAQPLLNGAWPLLRVWGDADELVPLIAYQRFATLSRVRAAPFCDLSLPGGNHSLQAGPRDGIQWLWARLEIWAKSPAAGFCERVVPP